VTRTGGRKSRNREKVPNAIALLRDFRNYAAQTQAGVSGVTGCGTSSERHHHTHANRHPRRATVVASQRDEMGDERAGAVAGALAALPTAIVSAIAFLVEVLNLAVRQDRQPCHIAVGRRCVGDPDVAQESVGRAEEFTPWKEDRHCILVVVGDSSGAIDHEPKGPAFEDTSLGVDFDRHVVGALPLRWSKHQWGSALGPVRWRRGRAADRAENEEDGNRESHGESDSSAFYWQGRRIFSPSTVTSHRPGLPLSLRLAPALA
jgi:hypothetical protein